MVSNIIIGNYEFDYCHRVEIESTWKTIGDKCTIDLPNIEGILEKQIKPGQEVIVKLGYDGLLVTEFQGYVSAISPRTPLRIECQDEVWNLRQRSVSKSWRSVSLEDVVKFLVPQAIVTVPGITLAPFRLDKVTVFEALEVIKEQYGLAVFFRGPELYVGLPYGIDAEPFIWEYHFQKNVASFGSLEYRRKEDVKVKLKAISIKPDNSRVEVELGDADGETHTLHFYNLTESELKQQAEAKLGLLKFDGYKGSFTAFGQPNAQHSGIAEIEDGQYKERGGKYFIDEVRTSYGVSGYRKEITLGKVAASSVNGTGNGSDGNTAAFGKVPS